MGARILPGQPAIVGSSAAFLALRILPVGASRPGGIVDRMPGGRTDHASPTGFAREVGHWGSNPHPSFV